MKRRTITLFVALFGVLGILGAPPIAMAKDKDEGVELKATLLGFEEVPAVSTGASGSFQGEISSDGTSITYTLSYTGLEGNVRQAHIHLGQRSVNGGIVIFLCQTTTAAGTAPPNPDPTGLAPICPPSPATVTGTVRAANVIGSPGPPVVGAFAQGIEAGEFAEVVRAIRAGVSYANVHSANVGGVATRFNAGEIRGQIKVHD